MFISNIDLPIELWRMIRLFCLNSMIREYYNEKVIKCIPEHVQTLRNNRLNEYELGNVPWTIKRRPVDIYRGIYTDNKGKEWKKYITSVRIHKVWDDLDYAIDITNYDQCEKYLKREYLYNNSNMFYKCLSRCVAVRQKYFI